ncbi:MAG: hypothetical protein HOO67_02405 [Candidatus Peribacteraceae bacterium]|nr:hypothetical protein [Candidatus Peribacteraceae bacterium]
MFRSPRTLALLSMSVLVTGILPLPALAFTDVKASTQYQTAINALQAKGVLQGYANGTFKPGSFINRAEFVKVIASAAFDQHVMDDCKDEKTPLKDVPANAWFAPYVCVMRGTNAVSGYPDGTFRPDNDINFAEAAKILASTYSSTFREEGEEWYTGTVRLLESAKAIPASVAKLDSFLTRGEMAEMMWRLTERKTDQPTKGLLNLQNPALSINTASDAVQYPKTCADLQAFATAAQSSGGPEMMYMRGNAVMEDAAAAPSASKATNQAGGDYSQTNVQVEGVDEADIVKTDGTFLYVLSNREKPLIRIIRATPASSMKLESTIDVSADMTPTEMYVDDGKLIVIGQHSFMNQPVPMVRDSAKMIAPDIYPWPGYYAQRTDVRIYDVSNAAQPKLSRTVSIDGNSVSTRKIGSKLYLVLQQPFYYGGPHILEADANVKLVPQIEDSKTGKTVDAAPCNRIAILPRVPSPQYMTVAVVPTDDLSKDVKTTVVLGSAENVYASLQNLYVATTRWNYSWNAMTSENTEQTRIYRFAFTDAGVELKAEGEVPGHILNQFSMDENESHFRIATTVGESWGVTQVPSSNNVHVLNMSMEQVGAVEGIAPGETIYSVRFMGDRAYMVTFKTVDPFFVLDMSNPRSPRVLGALKIPGFSNYLHPYDATHVIGFGKDVDESIDADKVHSTDAIYYTAVQGLKMAMFDVTDVANPKQMAVTVIGDRGTDSPLLTNHKALLFDKERDLLAFPIMVTKRPAGSPKSAEANTVFQGAYVYDVSLAKGFDLRGTITHYDNTDDFIKAGSYWYGGANDIQRIVRIGKQLLTVSDAEVRSHSETDVKEEGKVDLK